MGRCLNQNSLSRRSEVRSLAGPNVSSRDNSWYHISIHSLRNYLEESLLYNLVKSAYHIFCTRLINSKANILHFCVHAMQLYLSHILHSFRYYLTHDEVWEEYLSGRCIPCYGTCERECCSSWLVFQFNLIYSKENSYQEKKYPECLILFLPNFSVFSTILWNFESRFLEE